VPFHTYTGVTDCGNECIEVVNGCIDSTAFNYNNLANTPEPCYYYPGCISPAYLEYHADTASGYYTDINIQDSCQTLVIFGCMDSTAFNYDSTANIDNGGCLPVIMGCMNPMAFNYNPVANTPDSCIAYLYGCTDPTMFNYSPLANVDDESCLPYVYGCTDSTAVNYDPSANTDNGSCIAVVIGCMDPNAWNYNPSANVSGSHCHYDAGCITGPGNPYWLNNECYAWVIDIDAYCCEVEWDTICQSTYDYCEGTWVGPPLTRELEDNLIIYPNPTNGKININKKVDIRIINMLGDMIVREDNVNVLDVSYLTPGMYNIQIIHNNKVINRKIIKE